MALKTLQTCLYQMYRTFHNSRKLQFGCVLSRFFSTRTSDAFCWINQRRKCLVSLRLPRFLCTNYLAVTKTQQKCLHRKRVQFLYRIALVEHVLCFPLFWKRKCPVAVNPKAKTIQSHVRRQNNCLSFGSRSMSSGIPTEQALFMSIYMYMVSIKHGLWITHYRLGMKHRLRFKTQTKHYGLGIKQGLRYKMWTVV